MSMSMHVDGIVPGDAKWEQMRNIWDSCKAAGVTPPDEVTTFFGGEPPDSYGTAVDLRGAPCTRKYQEDMVDGFEVDLSKLPAKVKILRFTCRY